jgi:hypothetical protein
MGILDRFRRGRKATRAAETPPDEAGDVPETAPADGDAVEIPKQTAAAEAADSQAGEGVSRP